MKVMTTSSWLNFGRPASSGRGSAAGWNFLAPRYYGQRAVFVCLHALFSLLHAVKPMPEKAVKMPLIATVTQTPVLVHWSVVHAWPQCCLLRGKTHLELSGATTHKQPMIIPSIMVSGADCHMNQFIFLNWSYMPCQSQSVTTPKSQ